MIDLLDAEHIKKQRNSLRSYLRGKCFNVALRALNLCDRYHIGIRKDGKTPEFTHQIQMALHATTLKLPEWFDTESLIVAILMHDLIEDYAVPKAKLLDELVDNEQPESLRNNELRVAEYAIEVATTLSKVRDGVKIDNAVYFDEVSNSLMAALTKGLDRINNFQSMVGVFSLDKQVAYLHEGMDILATLKKARKKFPEFTDTFYGIEYMLKSQIELISKSIEAIKALQQRNAELEGRIHEMEALSQDIDLYH